MFYDDELHLLNEFNKSHQLCKDLQHFKIIVSEFFNFLLTLKILMGNLNVFIVQCHNIYFFMYDRHHEHSIVECACLLDITYLDRDREHSLHVCLLSLISTETASTALLTVHVWLLSLISRLELSPRLAVACKSPSIGIGVT